MTRIYPDVESNTPVKTAELLQLVSAKLGKVPNFVKTVGLSPAALKSYLGQSEALANGELSLKLREQIALSVAGFNGCSYCAAVHASVGKRSGLDDSELEASFHGRSANARTNAALSFANQILEHRGAVSDSELQRVRDAGFTDGEIVEIIANVGMNVFTNYFNILAKTTLDFPAVNFSPPLTKTAPS